MSSCFFHTPTPPHVSVLLLHLLFLLLFLSLFSLSPSAVSLLFSLLRIYETFAVRVSLVSLHSPSCLTADWAEPLMCLQACLLRGLLSFLLGNYCFTHSPFPSWISAMSSLYFFFGVSFLLNFLYLSLSLTLLSLSLSPRYYVTCVCLFESCQWRYEVQRDEQWWNDVVVAEPFEPSGKSED